MSLQDKYQMVLNPSLNWNLEMWIFVEGGKPEHPWKNPQSKGENQPTNNSTHT
jgi:hypothetical protein